MMQKKQYTAAFKAQVVQEALREDGTAVPSEDKTLSQLGAIHGVHGWSSRSIHE